jgi:hypothetical protein
MEKVYQVEYEDSSDEDSFEVMNDENLVMDEEDLLAEKMTVVVEEEVPIAGLAARVVRLHLFQHGYTKLDLKGKKITELRQMLKDEVGKDTVSPNVLPCLPNGWTYEIPENFGERRSPNRLPGPKKDKGLPHHIMEKVKLEDLKEIDIAQFYIPGNRAFMFFIKI